MKYTKTPSQPSTSSGVARLILSEIVEKYGVGISYLQRINGHKRAAIINVLKDGDEKKAIALLEEDETSSLFLFNTRYPYSNGPHEKAIAFRIDIKTPDPNNGDYKVTVHRGEGTFLKSVRMYDIMARFGGAERSEGICSSKTGFDESHQFFFSAVPRVVNGAIY